MEFLSHKTWLWKRIFCNLYLYKHQLYDMELKTELEPEMLVRCCRNVDDLSEIWNLAEYIDSNEEELTEVIANFCYCRPIPWQYEFVRQIVQKSKRKILQTLDMQAITDAFCTAWSSRNIDLTQLLTELDRNYTVLYQELNRKQQLHKRNFSLIMETQYETHYVSNAANLNYREIVDLYLPSCGIRGIVEAMKQAQTADIKLSKEERSCQAFAYYSPYFCNEVNLCQNKLPQSSIFSCAEEYLHIETEHWNALQQALWQAEDEDEEDEIRELMETKHNAVFVDPQERCLIDVWFGKYVYANVYVQKFPLDDMNNSMSDFIRYHNGCLYTVEFVDDIRTIEVAADFLARLNSIKYAMLKMEKACHKNPGLALKPAIKHQFEQLEEELSRCYYVYC